MIPRICFKIFQKELVWKGQQEWQITDNYWSWLIGAWWCIIPTSLLVCVFMLILALFAIGPFPAFFCPILYPGGPTLLTLWAVTSSQSGMEKRRISILVLVPCLPALWAAVLIYHRSCIHLLGLLWKGTDWAIVWHKRSILWKTICPWIGWFKGACD